MVWAIVGIPDLNFRFFYSGNLISTETPVFKYFMVGAGKAFFAPSLLTAIKLKKSLT